MQQLRFVALIAAAGIAVAACGQTTAPTLTPAQLQSPNAVVTETRVAELAPLATLTVPTEEVNVVSTPNPPTASLPPTTVPPPPTETPLAPTRAALPSATTVPPTSTPDYSRTHAEYFVRNSRRAIDKPMLLDVTGDGVPDFIYASHNLGCASCRIQKITVFSGPTPIFDDGSYFEPTVEALPGGGGFVIIERKVLPGEPMSNPSGRIAWNFRWSDGKFVFEGKREYTVNASAPTVPPPASGRGSTYPTPTPNRVGGDTRPGVYLSNNWQWQGMPMPAGVYHLGESATATGFWVNASESAVFNWFANNWHPAGYTRQVGYTRPFSEGFISGTYCRADKTDCFVLSTRPAAREPANFVSPYPGYTMVIVSKR